MKVTVEAVTLDAALFTVSMPTVDVNGFELDSANNILRINKLYKNDATQNLVNYALARNHPWKFSITGWKWKAGVTAVTSITFSMKTVTKETPSAVDGFPSASPVFWHDNDNIGSVSFTTLAA